MKNTFYLLIALFIFSCNNPASEGKINDDNLVVDSSVIDIENDQNSNGNNDTVHVIDDYFNDPIVKSYTSNSDTLVVSENCVIFLWPDSIEVEEMKAKYPDGYAEILDDMIYYASDAAIALDTEGIKNFFCDKSTIQFKGDKKDIFIKRKKTNGNMILFKFGEKPVIMNAIDFEIEFCRNFFAATITDSIK
ncbi:MAG TPA: hypothetical protein PKN32_12480 [Bacteroidales bacterium]|nr:hypothetical protein [Bacteroidales bacterium]